MSLGSVDFDFICCICYTIMTEPVTIPCKHSFCMACISKAVSL